MSRSSTAAPVPPGAAGPGQDADRSLRHRGVMAPTVGHVTHLHLVVADLARSVAFYRAAFEFEERYTSQAGVVFLQSAAGGSLALEQADADQAPGLGHFGFSLSDPSAVGAVVDRVVACGGAVVDEDELVAGHPHALVTDPDGHVIRL